MVSKHVHVHTLRKKLVVMEYPNLANNNYTIVPNTKLYTSYTDLLLDHIFNILGALF